MRLAVFALVLTVTPGLAAAAECVLRSGAEKLFVWKNEKAFEEATEVMKDGGIAKNRFKLVRYAECIVDRGLRAEVVARRPRSVDIVVLGGPRAGCRGTVGSEFCPVR